MGTHFSVVIMAVYSLAEVEMANIADPVVITGIVAMFAIFVFALTIIAVVIFGNSENTAREALKALVQIWHLFWS